MPTMQPYFSTDGIHPKDAFRRWREAICDRMHAVELRKLGQAPFKGRIEVMNIGPLPITRTTHAAMRAEATAQTIRRNGRTDRLYAIFNLSGQSVIQQNDREAATGAGDLVVIDSRPAVNERVSGTSLTLDLPRERFETLLGRSHLYTAQTISADLASASLALSFLKELIQSSHRLAPDAANRMASVSIDLIVASLAERMAQEVPRSIHGNVTVQRAKAYVEANLGDLSLDPPKLAAAAGVSLRRLQELFHEGGRHISDYIWQRRLEAAAKRLTDPACAHLSIGMLAYGTGFSSQAHFARRFKEHYGMTPREFRRAALLCAP